MKPRTVVVVALLVALPGAAQVLRHLNSPPELARAVVGTLDDVNPSDRTIVLQTAGDRLRLTVEPDAPIHSGPHTLSLQDLAEHTSEPVKVRLYDRRGTMVVGDVRLAADPTRGR